MTTTLAEDFPKQQARCREILFHAIEIGPPGRFLASMLRNSLAAADAAAASGDLIAMLKAYRDLSEYQE